MKNLSPRDRRAFLKEARRLSSFHMSKLQSDRGGDILPRKRERERVRGQSILRWGGEKNEYRAKSRLEYGVSVGSIGVGDVYGGDRLQS